MRSALFFATLFPSASAVATGFRIVGTSGCTPQMVFMPPSTNTVVFIDNTHKNYGGPGFDPFQTVPAANHSTELYVYEGTQISVFGTEFDLGTNTIRPLKPISNTFCSAGSFFPNGTLLNMAGAEPTLKLPTAGGNPTEVIPEGFDKIRTFNPGPCKAPCKTDWIEQPFTLQTRRWYPSAQTLIDGSILVVGGSKAGGIVVNEAKINVPTYEIIHYDGKDPKPPVVLPILEFTEAENLVPAKSYNLYPILHLLPNTNNANEIFSLAGTRTVVWDYIADKAVTELPDIPKAPRTFPASASSVLLPLAYPNYVPKVLVCGGSNADMPDPKAVGDCFTIEPQAPKAAWVLDDSMPNGPQVMSSPILLPDGKLLLLGGAHKGSAGAWQADQPALAPILYDPAAPAGSRWKSMPPSTIPRLYHSTAILLPSGEVLVAGSNPSVLYNRDGYSAKGIRFTNDGHLAPVNRQQDPDSRYPTEYRVEIFSPPYMEEKDRPVIMDHPNTIGYSANFEMKASYKKGKFIREKTVISLISQGFHTHAVGMGQRNVQLGFEVQPETNKFIAYGPRDATVMPPGKYLLFITADGIPSEGVWVTLK